MPEITTTLAVTNRDEWRAWLAEHHAAAKEIWLILYKKNSGRPGVRYEEAVEEALCYGWIDGIAKSIDGEKRAQRFTPRRPGSNWSAPNKTRVRRLIAEGKMTEAGLRALGTALDEPDPPPSEPGPVIVPGDLAQALEHTPHAREQFDRLPEGYKRTSLRWIESAKQDATRQRRIAEFVALTARGERLGPK